MLSSEIDEAINVQGYAKVIVTLAPPVVAEAVAAGGPLVSMRAARTPTHTAAAGLENHFVIPAETQAESLAVTARSSASKDFRRSQSAADRRMRVYPHLGLAIGYVNRVGASALDRDPAVSRVEKAPELSLIRPVATRAVTPKAAKTVSWGIVTLEVDKLWAAGFDGKGVLVGHLDTGVDGKHPALKGAIAAFAEFDMAGDEVVGALPYDSGEHGTHTAGTIAARPGAKGSFGVAPGAQLASALVIEGGQVIDRILSGMDWIIARGCRILSMSLGLRGYTPAFEQIINALRAAGVLPIIAVGNEGPLTSRSPGNYSTVLSVGAMDIAGAVASFSSSQTFSRPDAPLVPDLVAPGVAVLSCIPGRAYAEMDGSSMATPHVAGLAAVLLQARPQATVDELEAAIIASCKLGKMKAPRANRGLPNGPRAYQHLTGLPLPKAAATASAEVARPRRRKPLQNPAMPVEDVTAARKAATRQPAKKARPRPA
ncbi:MAG: hypothetical protein JWR51_3431 [Devosia sp.]|uniref:S8 family peptidase n=1 Tax=Devosia sp. TaxID=1871048 RepID=UPI0026367F28|nr:S8 family serine peptidase [Devosia sp.]MDB5530328.1 hypothetical protein [Devosia sp.]